MDRLKNVMWWAGLVALCAIPVIFQFGAPALGEWFTCGAVRQSNVTMLRALAVVLTASALVFVACGAIALLADDDHNNHSAD